jgi:uncharacterized C2H2 Zn-finger protein
MKLSIEEFINKANKKHNYKFNYSKSIYINNKVKIIIICPSHGEFSQSPDSHLSGKGCAACGGKLKLTRAEFIRRSIIIHDNKYSYEKVNFVNSSTKVEIICPIHQSFLQSPTTHIYHGCPKCGNSVKYSTIEFIEKANKKHNNKYDYSKVEYINAHKKVEIICPKHGSFYQKPNSHLLGNGCPYCCNKLTIEQFIEKANEKHKFKYLYELVNYINSHIPVIIICSKHGKFKQSPNSHLNGRGCRKCSMNCISKKEIDWILSLNNPNIISQYNIKIDNKSIFVDGYDPITNTVYEFYGDFWHGNPKVYNGINWINNKSFNELYENTIKRELSIKKLGYNLITRWETI